MDYILSEAMRAFSGGVYSGWILWNLFLAVVPLGLSYWLFRRRKQIRTAFWWGTFAVFLVFLPNAPYMLTDIIHLIRGAQNIVSIWVIALIFVPLHMLAILGGFVSYVLSLINLNIYLKRQGFSELIPGVEMVIHALCAIGIFIGRFRRFNSWDLVTTPTSVLATALDDVTSKRPLLVIFVTFVILAVLYWVVKQIILGLMLRVRYARAGMDVLKDVAK